MANINLRKRLDSITTDLTILVKHVEVYSGVGPNDVAYVEMSAKFLEEAARRLRKEAADARKRA